MHFNEIINEKNRYRDLFDRYSEIIKELRDVSVVLKLGI